MGERFRFDSSLGLQISSSPRYFVRWWITRSYFFEYRLTNFQLHLAPIKPGWWIDHRCLFKHENEVFWWQFFFPFFRNNPSNWRSRPYSKNNKHYFQNIQMSDKGARVACTTRVENIPGPFLRASFLNLNSTLRHIPKRASFFVRVRCVTIHSTKRITIILMAESHFTYIHSAFYKKRRNS